MSASVRWAGEGASPFESDRRASDGRCGRRGWFILGAEREQGSGHLADPGDRAVHEHRGFHGDHAAGAAAHADPGHQPGAIRPGRRVVHDQRGDRGIRGVRADRPVRAQGRLPLALRRVPGRDAVVRVGDDLPAAAGGPGGDGGVRRGAGRDGDGHRRRRLPGPAPGAGDWVPDVVVLAGVGLRRAVRAVPRQPLRLARLVPDAGGPGLAGPRFRHVGLAAAPRPPEQGATPGRGWSRPTRTRTTSGRSPWWSP
jgi:hypothetical protein